jgi:hypothetical protein
MSITAHQSNQRSFEPAVINGFMVPPMLFVIMSISNNRTALGDRVNAFWANTMGLADDGHHECGGNRADRHLGEVISDYPVGCSAVTSEMSFLLDSSARRVVLERRACSDPVVVLNAGAVVFTAFAIGSPLESSARPSSARQRDATANASHGSSIGAMESPL